MSNGLLLLLIGFLYKRYPPKKINYLYGYRTRRSMANQKVWNYANGVGAQMLIRVGWFILVIGFVTLYFFPSHALLITTSALVISLLASIYLSEKELDRHFDKDGNPRVK